MKRVVVTGIGILSCLGLNKSEVLDALRQGRSGIREDEEFKSQGLRSQISGQIDLKPESEIDRRHYRFMNTASGYAYLAMQQAIEDAALTPEQVSNPRTGLVVGTGGPSTENVVESVDLFREGGVRKVGPFRVTRGMCSSASSTLATHFHIEGVNYSMTSACATSAHCIGHAMELIQLNKQDVVFAGGADFAHWSLALHFDAMGALSTRFNLEPERASRPYDTDRDGFVIASGAGILVLESLEHALARNAPIYAELAGYGATSDGRDMVQPSGVGAERCMRQALEQAGNPTVDYINAHGTSTPIGDLIELQAIQKVFPENPPLVSSTKSLSGHSLGAAGVHEAIYTLLMMQAGFASASANLESPEPLATTLPVLRSTQNRQVDVALSNSFGFGGTNASLLFRRAPQGSDAELIAEGLG